MPRRAPDGIPGTVYAKGGYLYIRVNGRVVATRLPDTAGNRRIAARLKRDMWLGVLVGSDTPTVAKAWERFQGEANVSARTMQGYEAAYVRMLNTSERSCTLTAEILTRAAARFRREHAGRLSPVTINTMLRNFRAFAMWSQRTYQLQPVDISSQMVRAPAPEPVSISRDVLEKLPRHPLTPLFCFMACTGARPVDALGLDPANVQDMARKPIPVGNNVPVVAQIVWRNKITKAPEPRPVHPDALLWLPLIWAVDRMHATTYSKVWRRVSGLRLKDARSTFLALIASLPWDTRVYLMRHHPQGVTERHYLTWDMDAIAESLGTVWLPTPRNVLAYQDMV